MGGRGQVSMEYLLVAGFAFLLLVPITIIAFTQSNRFQHDVTAAQIERVGSTLTDAANAAYYAGPPTVRTLELYFPAGVRRASFSNSTITFTVQGETGEYEYAASARTNLTGSLETTAGVHTIIIVAAYDHVNITG